MGGGSGLKYAASSIVYLGKRKEKDSTEVIGNVIHCKNYKSRLTKENAQIDVRLIQTRFRQILWFVRTRRRTCLKDKIMMRHQSCPFR